MEAVIIIVAETGFGTARRILVSAPGIPNTDRPTDIQSYIEQTHISIATMIPISITHLRPTSAFGLAPTVEGITVIIPITATIAEIGTAGNSHLVRHADCRPCHFDLWRAVSE